MRTSGRSSPGLRARRSSNGDEEPSSGRRGYGGGALRARSEGGGERVYWAQMGGEGEGEWGSGHKWPRARWGESHARRGRGEGGREQLGGGYARKTGLTGWAHGQRESEGAGARGEAAAPTGGAGRAVREGGGCAEGGRADRPGPLRRERRGGREARAGWADWAERPRRAGKWAALPFSFILNCFSLFFLLILFDSNSNEPQIQIRLFENYAPNKSEI